MTHPSLITYAQPITTIKRTRPQARSHDQWPPTYNDIFAWRASMLKSLSQDQRALESARIYYRSHPAEFIMDWMDTYDPRVRPPKSKWMPFVFFKRQYDVVEFINGLIIDQESGLVEKCRDFGLSWIACAYSVWCWLFLKDFAIGWGSRKETLVDKPGDPDSLFEKMRLIIRRLPHFWLPKDFNWTKHSTFMKITNPANGSIIAGEAGDNIGRGGRRSMQFIDESAHLERPEKVEAALGDNTNVRIDISSVNGVGNVFHRRRENGVLWTDSTTQYPKGFVRVFVADWRDHPGKDQEWYDTRKARYEREGMSHIFAQEVDRNYTAAVSNVVIPYEWIESAVDAHIHIPYLAKAIDDHKTEYMAGLDVADEGGDRNALAITQYVIWREVHEWGERDPGLSARRAIEHCRPFRNRIKVQYDSIGVGSGVKTEYNRLIDERLLEHDEMPFVPWNAGAAVIRPYDRVIPDDTESLLNKNFYANLKAQAWWSLRTRFYKTFKARTQGDVYNTDELISLDSTMPLLEQVKKELTQPTTKQSSNLKMLIDKRPDGMKSPNLADAGVMAFFPVGEIYNNVLIGRYGKDG